MTQTLDTPKTSPVKHSTIEKYSQLQKGSNQ